jgi:hypothetical protein
MTNKLLALLLLVVALAGGYFVWQQTIQPATPATTSQTPQPDFKVTKIAFSQDGNLLVTVQNVGASVSAGKLHMTVDATTLVRNTSGPGYQSQKIPNHIFDGDVTPPSAGMNQIYTLKVPASAFEIGIHDMTVVLNGNGAISESNTQNNTFTDAPTMPVIPHEGE